LIFKTDFLFHKFFRQSLWLMIWSDFSVLQNPDYMKENFVIKIESMHIGDRGETENVR